MTTQYSVKVGDEVIDFEGPDNLDDRQIERLADTTLRKAKPGQRFPHSQLVASGTFEDPNNAPKQDSSTLGSFFRKIPSGGLLNFDDEIAAAANAVVPGLASLDNATDVSGGGQRSMYDPSSRGFSDTYANNMADFRKQNEADVTQHPIASSLGEIGGTLATAPFASEKLLGIAPKGIKAFMDARPVLSSIPVGATIGAVSGAGAGEGNRAQSAALGGLSGAALAFGLSGAIKFAPTVARYAKMLFKGGATENAISQMQKALMRDGFDVTTPQGKAALEAELARYGAKPVSLADIGSNTRARTGVGLRTPNAGQQQAIDIIASREAGAPQRIAGDIRTNVAPRTDVHALDDALIAQRAEEAGPLREKALFEQAPVDAPPPPAQVIQAPDAPDDGVMRTLEQEPERFQRVPATTTDSVPIIARQSRVVEDPELQQLARLPLAQRALTAALGQANAERDLLAATGQSIDHLPDLSRGSQLDMRSFDYLKRYLDDEVNRLYKRGDTSTFSAAEANQVKDLRNAIREGLRRVNPDYADYLDAYKGSSEMIDALEQGRGFDKLDPEEITKLQSGHSEAAQELYRVGAARNLLDKIRNTRDGAAAAKRILNSDESRAQLAATGVTPANMSRLNTAVDQERALSLLNDELKGSQTDARRLAAEDAASHGVPFSGGISAGGGYGWLGLAPLAKAIINRSLPARNAAINEQLLPRMLERNPKALKSILAELEAHGLKADADKLRRAMLTRNATVNSNIVLGGMVALPNTGDQ